MAATHTEVQRAAATLRWTGSWHTVFLSVDRKGGRPVDDLFEADLRATLEPFRMAGHDLEIDGPRFVNLDLALAVCVEPDFYQADVVLALRQAFGRGLLSNGRKAFFHPDNFTFGQPVLLSRIYDTAMRVPGVRMVEITRLRRQGTTLPPLRPAGGELEIGRLEIARLDSDPNFPDRGVLSITPRGGR
jgi:hypothetical protein